MLINIPDLEVAYLSSHEGSLKLQYFWFQYHVCHLSAWTIIQLFMASLIASKLSRQFWSSKRKRARASDFSSKLTTTGSVTIIHKISVRYTEGFCTQRCMECIDLKNSGITSSDISLRRVLMVFALILYKTRNDLNMLFSR